MCQYSIPKTLSVSYDTQKGCACDGDTTTTKDITNRNPNYFTCTLYHRINFHVL